MSKKEFFNVFNSLVCVPKILLNENVLIYLRNECWVAGKITDVDGFMNITFNDAVYCDQKGLTYRMENFMVRFRQILYIKIPDNIDIQEAVRDFMSRMHNPQKPQTKKRTFKTRRAIEKNQQTIAEIQNKNP